MYLFNRVDLYVNQDSGENSLVFERTQTVHLPWSPMQWQCININIAELNNCFTLYFTIHTTWRGNTAAAAAVSAVYSEIRKYVCLRLMCTIRAVNGTSRNFTRAFSLLKAITSAFRDKNIHRHRQKS